MNTRMWFSTIRFILPVLLVVVLSSQMKAGRADVSADMREMDQRIEDAVVRADLNFLESVYASDFPFTHGTGKVQNKAEWLKSVARKGFLSRKISAVEVELHGDVTVTSGRLDVTRRGEAGKETYALRYVRVYERRNGRWEMLMHRTVEMLSRQEK